MVEFSSVVLHAPFHLQRDKVAEIS